MKNILLTISFNILFLTINAQIPGVMFDSRDGKEYRTVTFEIELEGEVNVAQEWMAENLNYESPDSYCYKDYAAYCEVYGKLYTWDAAKDVCPEGWHIPASHEWEGIYKKYGTTKDAGLSLLAGGESGLDLIMGGFGELDGQYIDVGVNAYYWKILDLSTKTSGLVAVHSDNGEISDVGIEERHKNSIRCVKAYEHYQLYLENSRKKKEGG